MFKKIHAGLVIGNAFFNNYENLLLTNNVCIQTLNYVRRESLGKRI